MECKCHVVGSVFTVVACDELAWKQEYTPHIRVGNVICVSSAVSTVLCVRIRFAHAVCSHRWLTRYEYHHLRIYSLTHIHMYTRKHAQISRFVGLALKATAI